MGLKVSKDDVPDAGLRGDVLRGGELVTKMVYGNLMSMMYSIRPDDYHSKPHTHNSEQINFVLKGKIWAFRSEHGAYLLEPGDFTRVPELAVHWSKVKEGPCIMVQIHSPPYIGDEDLVGEDKGDVVKLLRSDETEDLLGESVNAWATESYADVEEEMIMEYYGERDN